MNKYGAISCFYNPNDGSSSSTRKNKSDLFFASKLELETYKVLVDCFGFNRVRCQQSFLIKPGTDIYKPLHWCIDFVVYDRAESQVILLIESKGMMTEVFKLKLALFQYWNPDLYNKLALVFGDDKPHKLRVPSFETVERFSDWLMVNYARQLKRQNRR